MDLPPTTICTVFFKRGISRPDIESPIRSRWTVIWKSHTDQKCEPSLMYRNPTQSLETNPKNRFGIPKTNSDTGLEQRPRASSRRARSASRPLQSQQVDPFLCTALLPPSLSLSLSRDGARVREESAAAFIPWRQRSASVVISQISLFASFRCARTRKSALFLEGTLVCVFSLPGARASSVYIVATEPEPYE